MKDDLVICQGAKMCRYSRNNPNFDVKNHWITNFKSNSYGPCEHSDTHYGTHVYNPCLYLRKEVDFRGNILKIFKRNHCQQTFMFKEEEGGEGVYIVRITFMCVKWEPGILDTFPERSWGAERLRFWDKKQVDFRLHDDNIQFYGGRLVQAEDIILEHDLVAGEMRNMLAGPGDLDEEDDEGLLDDPFFDFQEVEGELRGELRRPLPRPLQVEVGPEDEVLIQYHDRIIIENDRRAPFRRRLDDDDGR